MREGVGREAFGVKGGGARVVMREWEGERGRGRCEGRRGWRARRWEMRVEFEAGEGERMRNWGTEEMFCVASDLRRVRRAGRGWVGEMGERTLVMRERQSGQVGVERRRAQERQIECAQGETGLMAVEVRQIGQAWDDDTIGQESWRSGG